jgi:hypothetical protein
MALWQCILIRKDYLPVIGERYRCHQRFFLTFILWKFNSMIRKIRPYVEFFKKFQLLHKLEQGTLKIVINCWNIKIIFYLEASGVQSFSQFLDVVYFLYTISYYTSVAAKSVLFLHSHLMCLLVFWYVKTSDFIVHLSKCTSLLCALPRHPWTKVM